MHPVRRPGLWLGAFLLFTLPAWGQSNIAVELEDVTDNRLGGGEFGVSGALELRVKVTGTNLEKASAARILIKEAKDDKGTDLAAGYKPPDFFPREYNNGTIQFGLPAPARAASKVRMKGSVELYVPGKDPAAVIKVDKPFARLDAPLSSKALKAAKIDLTLLSKAGYAKALEARKLDEKKIAEIRAEAKKQGVSEKEVELMLGLAQAFDASDAEVPENAVLLSGTKDAFDRIYRVEILGADGKPIDVGARSTSTRGDDSTIMMLQPSAPVPDGAALQLQLLTQKARVSTPFELTVELP